MKISRLRSFAILTLSALIMSLSGCTSHPSLPTPSQVDLQRFMGPWFVIGYTPIIVDKEAYNAVEHYFLDEDEKIQTTYQFRKGSATGDLKTYTPVGTVYNTETNAEWRMQFIWPFKAAYVILHLSEDYGTTVVVHPNRKYAWIMHRQPEMPEQEYQGMLDLLEAEGYDREIIRRLPQDWTRDAERLEVINSTGASKPLANVDL